ncbi:MAG: hypothetical protein Q4D26_07695 [Clostridia bacterium]|nr:hypothetical protein [Clostridia bacterium]
MATKKTTDTETIVENTTVDTAPVTAVEAVETSYTKKQIIESQKYSKYIDILNTLLGNRKYTFSEVDNLLKEFLSKEVD